MHTAARIKQPWETSEYLWIVTASYGPEGLVVRFKDGTEGRVDVERLPRVQARGPDWSALRCNEYEILVPTTEGDVEISSFAIRSLSDAAFAAHLKAKEAESARWIGHRIQALRRARGLTIDDLTERAGIALSLLTRIEQGDHDGNLVELQRVVEAMGCGLKDLIRPEVEEPAEAEAQTA